MNHHSRLALVSGLLALAMILPVQAQDWRGSEAIGVQAADSKGKPIVGARVVLSFQGRGSESDPPAVETNQKGRAVIAGLATGPWQVEVQHPDFLSYVAVFDLARGKKPSINASFLEAGGGSLTPMKVKLSKGNPRDASPPLPTREARSQAPPPPSPEPTTIEAAPTPVPAEATPTPQTTATEEPSRQAEVQPEPEPEPETSAPVEPPSPAPTESTPSIEEPPTPEGQESQVPEPISVTVPEKEQESEAPPVEARPEPIPEARAAATEPVPQPTEPAEGAATGEAPEELESRPVAETVDEIPGAQTPPPSEPEPDTPEPVEEEPTAESLEIEEAPVEPLPAEVTPEPSVQPVVPSAIAEEVPGQDAPSEAPSPTAEPVDVVQPPTPQAEAAPVVERDAPPRAPVAPAPVAAPDDTPVLSSYRDGSCSECRTGEWAVTATETVAAGSSPCPAGAAEASREAADSLGNSMQLELSGFVGPTAAGSGRGALATAEPEVSQAYLQHLAPLGGGASNCRMVSVVLPKSVRFVGFRYEVFDGAGGGECTPDRGCPLAQAQWLANPVVQRGFNATVVWGILENTDANAPRLARLKVYFRPPSSRWQPPTR